MEHINTEYATNRPKKRLKTYLPTKLRPTHNICIKPVWETDTVQLVIILKGQILQISHSDWKI